MNDIIKDKIRRFFQKTGVRLQKYPFYKYPQDRMNYPELAGIAGKEILIFDVGANIGQTSRWLRQEFPEAKIHAFEPFGIVFNELVKNTLSLSVECHQLGMSDSSGERVLPRNNNPLNQTASIEQTVDATGDTETIRIDTIDRFCATNGIAGISILKTDTEGHDRSVLAGAAGLLGKGAISNILTEATIDPRDDEHSNLFELIGYLRPFGYELYSLYDLNHNHETGRLQYFNALFKREAAR